MKILIFLLLLLTYLVWVSLMALALKDLMKGKAISLANEFFLSLISVTGFYAMVWILSGFYNLSLTTASFVLLFGSMIISRMVWAFVGSYLDEDWLSQVSFLAQEIIEKNVPAAIVMGILTYASVFVFPIGIGIVYFSNDVSTSEGVKNIIKYSLIFQFVGNYAAVLPQTFNLFLSRNIDETIRSKVLVNNISALLGSAMWLALGIWAFGAEGEFGYPLTLGELTLTISPVILIILSIYFVVTLFLPYLVGFFQAKVWRKHLLEKESALTQRLLEVLEYPKLSASKLEDFQSETVNELVDILEDDKTVPLAFAWENGDNSVDNTPERKILHELYKKSKHLDPRFRFMIFVRNLRSEVEGIISEFKTDPQAKAETYLPIYRSRKEKIDAQLKTEGGRKPQIYIAVAFIISPIFTQIVSELGKVLSELIVKNIK